jgi:hypothetical protein
MSLITIPNIDCNKVSSGTQACDNFNKIINAINTLASQLDTQCPIVYSKTGMPNSNDDIKAGYKNGDIWNIKNMGRIFICSDNTAGNAIWKEI